MSTTNAVNLDVSKTDLVTRQQSIKCAFTSLSDEQQIAIWNSYCEVTGKPRLKIYFSNNMGYQDAFDNNLKDFLQDKKLSNSVHSEYFNYQPNEVKPAYDDSINSRVGYLNSPLEGMQDFSGMCQWLAEDGSDLRGFKAILLFSDRKTVK